MKRRILKWSVPVNDQWHRVGRGRVVHVACQHNDPSVVQVWTEEREGPSHPLDPMPLARVFATGADLPDGGEHVGSTLVYEGRIVWHVLRKPSM
jgi:hypothetical protein